MPDDAGARSTATSSAGCSRRTGASCRCCPGRSRRCGGWPAAFPLGARVVVEPRDVRGGARARRPRRAASAPPSRRRRSSAGSRRRTSTSRPRAGSASRPSAARPSRTRTPASARPSPPACASSRSRTRATRPTTRRSQLADAVVRSLDELTVGVLARLEQPIAAGVEGADPRRERRVEVLAEHREDRDVAQRPARARRQPPPQRRLLDEAELARDAEARLVLRLDPDLDPVRLADLEADARQRRASTRSRAPAASRSRGSSSRSRAPPGPIRGWSPVPPSCSVSSAEKIPYVKLSPVSKCERKLRSSSIFSSSVCGSCSPTASTAAGARGSSRPPPSRAARRAARSSGSRGAPSRSGTEPAAPPSSRRRARRARSRCGRRGPSRSRARRRPAPAAPRSARSRGRTRDRDGRSSSSAAGRRRGRRGRTSSPRSRRPRRSSGRSRTSSRRPRAGTRGRRRRP